MAPARRSASHPRNGPPDAVKMRRRRSPSGLPPMHCNTALCSESTGTISPPPSRAACCTRSPAITNVSLLASATLLPAFKAAIVASSPAAPTTALTTMSTSGWVAASTRQSAPDSRSHVELLAPDHWPSPFTNPMNRAPVFFLISSSLSAEPNAVIATTLNRSG